MLIRSIYTTSGQCSQKILGTCSPLNEIRPQLYLLSTFYLYTISVKKYYVIEKLKGFLSLHKNN